MEDEMKNFISRKTLGRLAMLFWVAAFVASFSVFTAPQLAAQQASQKTFESPGHAANALYMAVKSGDTNQLMVIFGPNAKPLLSSGDPVADKNDRAKIVEKYDQMHRLVIEPDKTVTIYMGAENWPFPIPLVKNTKGTWYFDTEKGKKEVLFRRIGRNETSTIDTLQALAAAEAEYATALYDGSTVRQYAPKIMSDEGKHNGLYWKPAAGEAQSPIGPLVAEATEQGYQKKAGGPTPFHGYIYRVLYSQGKDAPGGAMSYMQDGKLTCGFAILAFPAEYRNSGVMTFIVGKDGQVYQKDLGPGTKNIAMAMTEYNPDSSWSIAE
jgi:hypothetical protein